MTHHKQKKKFQIKLRSFYLWHRYIGLSVSLLAILLAVTGLLLNHTDDLRLDNRHVESEWLLDWYGIDAPQTALAYSVDGHWISQLEDKLYLDEHALPGSYSTLIGAVSLQGLIVVAADGQLMLLTADGELVERLSDADGVPSGTSRIGRLGKQLAVASAHGIYLTDTDFSVWQQPTSEAPKISWITSFALPTELERKLKHNFRRHVLPMERLLLDLHSGRIFGSLGVYLMDAAAILLILLAGSGFWIWLQQRRKRAAHKRSRVET